MIVSHLHRGLYETLVSRRISGKLKQLSVAMRPKMRLLREAEAPDRLALHLGRAVKAALEHLPEKERLRQGHHLLNRLIEVLAAEMPDIRWIDDQLPEADGLLVLEGILKLLPSHEPENLPVPLVPLLDTTLLTHAPGEPRLQSQLLSEIRSADRIDLIVAFIRRTGLLPLRDALQAHTHSGRQLRVLTTTYTGSTEVEALDQLKQLGAEIRVSYDTSAERLHAKAWLFHRDSGFSTAYIGSSNLTRQAQVTGLEWNIRVAQARNPDVIAKMAAAFESYWEDGDFEPYNQETFRLRTDGQQLNGPALVLSPIELRPEPFQSRMLDQLTLARLRGHHRNLLVSATGTGKTVMAALDYARLIRVLPRARLLFVAHRYEILDQSMRTFRHVLREPTFGGFWVGGARPARFDFVFASIQSLSERSLDHLDPGYFDVVIIDEFHHAAAGTYRRLLDHLQPRELLGLTATPERADGVDVTHWFDGRIAAEMRLWDAIEQRRLVPFHYYGLHMEQADFRDSWRRQGGYDIEGLTRVLTAHDAMALQILKELDRLTDGVHRIRALGFCVSVAHAQFMARVFNARGVPAKALWGNTPDEERRDAMAALRHGDLRIIFSVDLFNEGVDLPEVDTLVLLRPTDSPVLFLQQLGRGLRKHRDKSYCTVLDFVGQHHRQFRLERRYLALLGGSRRTLAEQISQGFPYLPAGCHLELDPIATRTVLDHVRSSIPSRWAAKAEELRALVQSQDTVTLASFLDHTGLDLDDIYDGKDHGWSNLQEAAHRPLLNPGSLEPTLRRACGRLLHVDDLPRLEQWLAWVQQPTAPDPCKLPEYDRRLLRMLVGQMLGSSSLRGATSKEWSLADGVQLLWGHPQVLAELHELFAVLRDRITHVTQPVVECPKVPLQIHARYTRLEILAAFNEGSGARVPHWQTGVYWQEGHSADLLAFTLDKDSGHFSPTTRYRDYAISPTLIHWESQSATRSDSRTGLRYQRHIEEQSQAMLFCRISQEDNAFTFLGPAQYESHAGERPMAITWRLRVPLPGDLFQAYRAVGA